MPLTNIGFVVPAEIRSQVADSDYVLMVEPDGTPYRISKADFLAGFSTGTTPPITHTVFLANFEGTDDSTVFTDKKGHTITPYGNAKISTERFKYGVSSAYFDGNGSRLSTPIVPDLHLLSGDFTIELWYYPLSTSGFQSIFSQWLQAAGSGGFILACVGGVLQFYFAPFSETNPILVGGNITADTWYHLAVTRQGNNFTLWLNGNAISALETGVTKSQINVPLSIGNYYNANGSLGASGSTDLFASIDDFRIQNIAAYTSAFAPPVAALTVS